MILEAASKLLKFFDPTAAEIKVAEMYATSAKSASVLRGAVFQGTRLH
jgi:hypothetical protein